MLRAREVDAASPSRSPKKSRKDSMAEVGAALKAVAQENAQLKLRLAKYEANDFGLYSCSQLSEDQPASQDEHGPLGDPTSLPPSQMIEMLEEFEAHSSPSEHISIRVAAILPNGVIASTVTLERGETLSTAASRSAAQESVAAAAAGPSCESKWEVAAASDRIRADDHSITLKMRRIGS